MSRLTEQHITVLRALVDSARATDSDVGMDVNVLAALLNDWAAVQQLADERETLITQIGAVIDDSGEWVICRGRDTIATMLDDYREGPKEAQP